MAGKKIRTVLGDISPGELGMTLTHEHLSLDFSMAFTPACSADKEKESWPLSMENLWWIRQNPYHNKENQHLMKEGAAVIEEMKFFKQHGGSCIVENTNNGIVRSAPYLKRLSEETGVHVVAGAGYYVDAVHPTNMDSKTEEALCAEMVSEVMEGCDGTEIKCGVIGEIGCTYPLTDNEKKVLRGTAYAQKETGCPVIIHPGRHPSCPPEIIRVISEAGGNVGKTVMSHLDRTIHDYGELAEFAAMGSYCEYDLFGIEVSHYQLADIDMPSDAERIRRIKHLVDEGYEDKLVIAHDIHTKHRLMKYGGHGYSHIPINVLPKMRKRDFSDEVIKKIMVENPRKWLQF